MVENFETGSYTKENKEKSSFFKKAKKISRGVINNILILGILLSGSSIIDANSFDNNKEKQTLEEKIDDERYNINISDIESKISDLNKKSLGDLPKSELDKIKSDFIQNPDQYNIYDLIHYFEKKIENNRQLIEYPLDILIMQMIIIHNLPENDNIEYESYLTGKLDENTKNNIKSLKEELNKFTGTFLDIKEDSTITNDMFFALKIIQEQKYFFIRYKQYYENLENYMHNQLNNVTNKRVPNPFDNSSLNISDIDETKKREMDNKRREEIGLLETNRNLLYNFNFYWNGLSNLYNLYYKLNQTIEKFEFKNSDITFEASIEDPFIDMLYILRDCKDIINNPNKDATKYNQFLDKFYDAIANIEKNAQKYEESIQSIVNNNINEINNIILEIQNETKNFNDDVIKYNQMNNTNYMRASDILSLDINNFNLSSIYDQILDNDDISFQNIGIIDRLENYKNISEQLRQNLDKYIGIQNINQSMDIPEKNIFSGLPEISLSSMKYYFLYNEIQSKISDNKGNLYNAFQMLNIHTDFMNYKEIYNILKNMDITNERLNKIEFKKLFFSFLLEKYILNQDKKQSQNFWELLNQNESPEVLEYIKKHTNIEKDIQIGNISVIDYIRGECDKHNIPYPKFEHIVNGGLNQSYQKDSLQNLVLNYFNHEINKFNQWKQDMDMDEFENWKKENITLFRHYALRGDNFVPSVDYAYENVFFQKNVHNRDKFSTHLIMYLNRRKIDKELFLYYLLMQNENGFRYMDVSYNAYIKNAVADYIANYTKSQNGSLDAIEKEIEKYMLLSQYTYTTQINNENIRFVNGKFLDEDENNIFSNDSRFEILSVNLYINDDMAIYEKDNVFYLYFKKN